MLKYHVLCARHIKDLNKVVNEYIASGWTPQGGVAAMQVEGNYMWYEEYMQAMVKDCPKHDADGTPAS